jgi:hypothetical protein
MGTLSLETNTVQFLENELMSFCLNYLLVVKFVAPFRVVEKAHREQGRSDRADHDGVHCRLVILPTCLSLLLRAHTTGMQSLEDTPRPLRYHKHQTRISIVLLTLARARSCTNWSAMTVRWHATMPSTGRVEIQPYMHNTRCCTCAGRPAIRFISSSAFPFSYWPAWANPCCHF